MSRTPEKTNAFEVAAIAGQAEVIGGLTYYRINPGTFLPWASRWCFHAIKWAPKASHIGATLADPPVASATIGAGAILAPARCSVWMVPAGGVVLTTANLLSPEQNCHTLYPGDSMDLGGWFGDLLLSEGPLTGVAEAWSWTNGVHQAALATALYLQIDQAVGFQAGRVVGENILP